MSPNLKPGKLQHVYFEQQATKCRNIYWNLVAKFIVKVITGENRLTETKAEVNARSCRNSNCWKKRNQAEGCGFKVSQRKMNELNRLESGKYSTDNIKIYKVETS